MRYFMIVLCMVFLMSCGGGGSGGTDLSCAPNTSDLVDPTVDLNGDWILTLVQTGTSTCALPPDWIVCNPLTMSVSGNNVSMSGTCTTDTGVTVSLSNTTARISANTLYWGATMSATVGSYTETDTVPCTSVAFTSTTSDTFSVTVSVSWSDSGDSGTCSTPFSGIFTS